MAVNSVKSLDKLVLRETAKHRAPGICAALFGFLLMFSGIMMIAVGKTATKQGVVKDNKSDLEEAGPAILSIGIILICIGFTYQYIRHKKFKKAIEEKRLRKLEGRANDYAMPDEENFDAIKTCDPVEEFKMEEPSTSNGIVLKVVSLPKNSVKTDEFIPEIVTEKIPKNDHSDEIIPPKPQRSHSARSLKLPSLTANQRSLSQTNIQQKDNTWHDINESQSMKHKSLAETCSSKTPTITLGVSAEKVFSLGDSPSRDYIPKGLSSLYTQSNSDC